MIELYSGTPGSGKSLHTAKDLYWYLRSGKKLVIANFEIDLSCVRHPECFLYIDNCDLVPDRVIEECSRWYDSHEKKENSIILIIDECQLLFNTRDWNRPDRRAWLSFFTQHRKYGVLCTLVAQFDEMLDKQVRALIEYETIHRKVSNAGFGGLLLKILTFGDWFVAIDIWYPMKKQTSFAWFRAHKKYYRLYDTFNTFNATYQIEDVAEPTKGRTASSSI